MGSRRKDWRRRQRILLAWADCECGHRKRQAVYESAAAQAGVTVDELVWVLRHPLRWGRLSQARAERRDDRRWDLLMASMEPVDPVGPVLGVPLPEEREWRRRA